MILRLDGVVCWRGAWFLGLFCYLIGDSYSSSANGRNGTWVLVRRWFPSFGGFALELAELADFGREAVLVELTPTWHGRRDTSAPKRTTRINRAMKGTPSLEQINTNQTHGRFLGFLRGGGVQGGAILAWFAPIPRPLSTRVVWRNRRWMSRNGARRGDCGRVVGRG